MTTEIDLFVNEDDVTYGAAVLGNRHETTNYVRFTGGGEFQSKRGGPRITVYVTHDEDEEMGSPETLRVTLTPGS